MSARRKVIAGNWKMNKTRDEALQFIYVVNQEVPSRDEVETVICASDVLLRCLVKRQGEELRIGAQNMHYEDSGAFTGETSPVILEKTGVDYVIIGHSERRAYFAETDDTVNKKCHAALKHRLIPIVCVGESLEERESGVTDDVVGKQIDLAVNGLTKEQAKKLIIAYEPIWAIGTGKTASSEQANETIAAIRKRLETHFGDVAQAIRILYGGSVSPKNIDELLAQTDIDGALVGGASLEPASFLALTKAAVR